MGIEEKAINGVLADILTQKYGLVAKPEVTARGRGGKRVDIEVRIDSVAPRFTAIEAKIGQKSGQQKAAIEDAMRWLTHPEVRQAVALCYPKRIAESTDGKLRDNLLKCQDFKMVEVDANGLVSGWTKGETKELVQMVRMPSASIRHEDIVAKLKEKILAASDCLSSDSSRKLADCLKLPWIVRNGRRGARDPRPARIATLLFINVVLLQDRLAKSSKNLSLRKLPDLGSVLQYKISAGSLRNQFLASWKIIRSVDFAPVIDPALTALEACPVASETELMLQHVVEGASDALPYLENMQLDHAGPIYHDLLESAKYDGSFYTSTAASVLLAELALPRDFLDAKREWGKLDRVKRIKICDPACGTGTLLMAAARTISNRFGEITKSGKKKEDLHKLLVENVLHGLDINAHGLHLAACMLTIASPSVDYIRMNLHRMKYGILGTKRKPEVRAGSLDMLLKLSDYLPGFAPNIAQNALRAGGEMEESLNLEKKVDLVIMNPPFTRNDIRGRQLNASDRKKVQEREKYIAQNTCDPEYRTAIDQTSIQTFFTPIADMLVKDKKGSMGMVVPCTFCVGAAAQGQRKLLHDRFHIEIVITSHDNRRIYFSENTSINESLIVARRRNSTDASAKKDLTAFVSLAENPSAATGAQVLSSAIRKALDGDDTSFTDYGTIAYRTPEQMNAKNWRAALFYDQSLEEEYEKILATQGIMKLQDLATVDPEGRRVRDAFLRKKQRQPQNYRALWRHKTELRKTMLSEPDYFIGAKKNMTEYANFLWEKRGSLLIANRLRLNLVRTPATLVSSPALGSAWVPIRPSGNGNNIDQIEKAWCVWFNSTAGILAILNERQKNLSYPSFSLQNLRNLPAPVPSQCDIEELAKIFEQLKMTTLLSLPDIDKDSTREKIDDAVLSATALSNIDLKDIRKRIAMEPSVTTQ